MRSPRIGVVVLHYRNRADITATVARLQEQTLSPAEVVVVDNGSGDGSADWLRANLDGVRVLALRRNRGYAAGMNAGIRSLRHSSLDAVLLLTHETQLAPDCLAVLAHHLESTPAAAAVGPLVGQLDAPELVWSGGGSVHGSNWTVAHHLAGERMADVEPVSVEVDWLDGCCLLLRWSATREVGPFHQRYFLYFEEVDYLWRLKQLGWSVVCVRAAQAWQRQGSPSRALLQRNRLIFIRRAAGFRAVRAALTFDRDEIERDRNGSPEGAARSRERERGVRAYFLGRRP